MRRGLVIAFVFCSSAGAQLVRCGGDASTLDAGADVTTNDVVVDQSTKDSPADVSSNDASDAATSCLVDAGTPGSLDNTFSTGAKVLGSFSPNAAAIDAQGRIYVAGTSADCGFAASGVVHRFNVDGTHDNAFGGADAASTGVCIHYDNVDTAYAIAVDSNGSIVVGGLSYGTRIHATVTRLTSTGAFDTTFNTTGKVDLNPTTSVDNGFAAVQGLAFYGAKIVATGSTEAIRPGVGTRHTGYVTRLNADGSLDNGFAGGTYKDTSVVGYYGVVVSNAGDVTTVGATVATPRAIVLRKLDVSGVPSSAFGDAGAFTTSVPLGDAGFGPSEGRALLAAGSNVLVGGPMPGQSSGDYSTGPAGVLAISSTGTIDTTFGTGGVTTVPPMKFNIGYQLTALALECDGKILFGSRYDDPDAASNANQDLGLSRLLANGALDPSFGTGGVTHFAQTGNEITVAVVQDPTTSKIVVVGANQNGQPVLTRFNP